MLKHKAKETPRRKTFEFIFCTRKNGTEFIKIVHYSREAGGWVEVARINISKNEWVQNNFSVSEIYEELRGFET